MNSEYPAKGCPSPVPFIPEQASIPYSTYVAMQGKYFLGQTELLTLGQGTYAWGELCNPLSGTNNLYVSFVGISNFSDVPLIAEIWFNANPLDMGAFSSRVTSANTALFPPPKNQVRIRSGQFGCETPTGGINAYDRIVPPHSTLSMDKDGRFIFGPGGNYLVFLKAPCCSKLVEARISFGWWEDKPKRPC